jgi:hypothetical protein
MTFVEIAMLLYCASFRWPVIVMKQLREKEEEEMTDVTRPRRLVATGEYRQERQKKYNEKGKEKR